MATNEAFVPNRLYEIPLADLQPDPNQPRKYLDPAALERLRKSRGYKQEDLARIMGKAISSISMTLSINRLPQTILDDCRKNPSVSTRVLIEIAAKKQERSMIRA